MLIAPEVAEALALGRPVVALESTLISHGLPRPRNLGVAHEVEATVRDGGAVPATVALVAGEARIGLDEAGLRAIAGREDVAKCGVRDLAPVAARGGYGATTVAATAHLAARAGVRVFATGGLGGIHRRARDTWDESADLDTLARTGIVVVCAGVKSILDVGATLERLETLGVTVLGFGSDRFAGFYLSDSGHPVPWRVDSPAEVAAILAAQAELGTDGRAIVVANPLSPDEQLDPELHDRVLSDGLMAADREGVAGKEVTPFLLDYLHQGDRGGEPRGQPEAGDPQRGPGGGDRRGHLEGVTRQPTPPSPIVVLGDVMVDVVARLDGAIAPGWPVPSRRRLLSRLPARGRRGGRSDRRRSGRPSGTRVGRPLRLG